MTAKAPKTLSKGQLAYEQERARKAGKSLDEWLKSKAKAEAEEAKKAAPKIEKKPGLITRLIDKAHKPL
jgi:membrane-bound lytic murein transglycosylase MltF